MNSRTTIIAIALSLAGTAALAGPPTGSTTAGTGPVATPWRIERLVERPYALTGEEEEPRRQRSVLVPERLGSGRGTIDVHRRVAE